MARKPKKEVEEKEAKLAENQDNSSNDRSLVTDLWNFLSSMKLGISLLLIMAIVSIIGTIWVPQNPATGQEDFVRFYNSLPFRAIMALLAFNLLVCSLNRWKIIVSTFKGPKPNFPDAFVKNLKSKKTAKLSSNVSETTEQLTEILKAKGYRVTTHQDSDSIRIASDKGYLGIIGPYLTHLSFIIMIIAVVVKFSGLVGWEGTLSGAVGQTYDLNSLSNVQGSINPADNFNVTINNFRTIYRPDGSIQQWYSDVTVQDQANQFDYSISVNHPLEYKGIKFYQMSYGNQFSGKASGPAAKDQPFSISSQDYVQAPGTDLYFVPANYNSQNNAILVDIYKGNQQVGQQGVAINTPLKYEQAEVKFEAASALTVLSVKKDPGVPVMGAGSILLVVGILISFLLRQRRIWAIVSPQEKGSLLSIGGLSAKDKHGLDNDIEDITEALEE